MDIRTIFEELPSCYRQGKVGKPIVYYFSVGEHRYTVRLDADRCVVEPGKTTEHADVVLKTTPALFEKMVLRGERPGALDIALGRIKTNDPGALKRLSDYFDLAKIG